LLRHGDNKAMKKIKFFIVGFCYFKVRLQLSYLL
jgi:hypothetical protein